MPEAAQWDTPSNLFVPTIQAIQEPSLGLSIPNCKEKDPAWGLLGTPSLLSGLWVQGLCLQGGSHIQAPAVPAWSSPACGSGRSDLDRLGQMPIPSQHVSEVSYSQQHSLPIAVSSISPGLSPEAAQVGHSTMKLSTQGGMCYLLSPPWHFGS